MTRGGYMEVNLKKSPAVRISYDEMEAFLMLPMPLGEDGYKFADVMDIIHKAGVKEHIDEKKVAAMIDEQYYDRECLIASGVRAVDGVDGYFEYNFNPKLDKKPKKREDGTVDYWSIHAVEIVENGQVLAIYHEPVDGSNGLSVKGKVIFAKKGRPLPPLTGKGFERSEDNITYTATMDGKIEMQNNRIMISDVYEINDDVGPNTGNIDFRGDVIIHGNVPTGAIVKATGSITIDGTVEGCYIDANKDVIIRGGMLGGKRGIIRSRGSIYAKFIQYANIKAEGVIDCDSLIGCDAVCNDKIYMHGKYASIIGGVIHAAKGIECENFGNELGIKTEIYVGVNVALKKQVKYLEDSLRQAQEDVEKINYGLKQLDELARTTGQNMANDPRRITFIRTRIVKQADVSTFTQQLARFTEIVESAHGASAKVINHVYPGVTVGINDAVTQVKEEQQSVAFFERTGKVVMFSMKDELVE